MKQDKRLVYFIIGFMLALLFTAITCECKDKDGQPDSNDRFESDTIYEDRYIEVPGQSGVFTDSFPEPKVEYLPDPELLEKYKLLKTENERLKAYAKAITKKRYERSYVSSDSVVKITVRDSITGTLDFQDVLFDIAPRDVLIKERIITNTIKKYPDFSLSLGGGIKLPTSFQEPISFEVVVGADDKKGYQYQFGFDTKGEARFTVSKKLFIKF